MKRLILVVLCALAFPVTASHIVGGEFEIRYLGNYQYRINLIIYFDEINGLPGNKIQDQVITARIFRVSDNATMRDVALPFISETRVDYTQPECSKGEIVTSRMYYSTIVTMPANQYGDPQGYYIVWERCCRNYEIDNIYSRNPAISPNLSAGQTFYLKFPPVVMDGQPLVNSSPRLFPPLNDYACPNRPYYADFAGVDDDGDSLVYSLVTPYNTHTGQPYPPLLPAPYPEVQWVPPFSLNGILGGNPDLKISKEGFLTVTPSFQGLFVFAVKCEEFRDGVKLGEVRRDFQMFVVDACPQAEPPQILGKRLTDATFTHDNTMNITFNNTVGDNERCIQVQVSDPDALRAEDGFKENISIRAIALNFKKDVSSILPTIRSGTLNNGDVKTFDICFPACPFIDGAMEIAIIAYDDACSLPLSDTLKITVNIQPPTNTNPYFITPDVTATIVEGTALQTWNIQARDDDGDPLIVGVIPTGFSLGSAGMNFNIIQQQGGLIDAQLTWDPRCDLYDFSERTDFEIKILVEDADDCNNINPAVMTLKLKIDLPENRAPVIDADLTGVISERRVDELTKKVFETIEFQVTGVDLDNDYITLGATGKGFNLNNYGIQFPSDEGIGNVSSTFLWNIQCDPLNLSQKDEFEFQFIVVDKANKCKVYTADTLDVVVKVLPPDNTKPLLNVASLNEEHVLADNGMTTIIGEQINLGLYGSDSDFNPRQDHIRIELLKAEGTVPPQGYVFAPADGKGNIETTFSWLPECSIFQRGIYENEYQFTFRIYDDCCFNVKADTVQVNMVIKDKERSNTVFNPANFITPNGDGCNDYFAMEGIEPSSCTLGEEDPNEHIALPIDNCQGRFENIKIFNRWGKKVFESERRDFRWYPDSEAAGVYFYQLNFSDKEYKGSITIRY